MKTRTAACAGLIALALLTAGCGKSGEQTAADCQKALAKSTAGATDRNRPEACKDLSQSDYEALLMSEAMKATGVIDQDGNLDAEELLNDDQ